MKDRPGWETEAAETSLAGDENSVPAGSDNGGSRHGATRVINLRDKDAVATAKAAGTFVRIDRKTKWGNPFVLGRDGTRDQVIARFAEYIADTTGLRSQVGELAGKTLACHCAPQACHGNVLAALADASEVTP